MNQEDNHKCCCDSVGEKSDDTPAALEMLPLYQPPEDNEPCCGPPAGPQSSVHEKPGYTLCHFVDGFVSTPAGSVPRIKTSLSHRDQWGTLMVRLGICRNDYKVAPGLYAAGRPDADAPVLVTANYKLSFDHLRRHLAGMALWVLVLDTRGINVWCAAGKGTFGTQEVIKRVQATQLAKVVNHQKLILPQLGAPGVAAPAVKKACGFEVIWGPVRAHDVPAFLQSGMKAAEPMRRVTFSISERLVLVPVEIALIGKYFGWAVMAICVLSGIGGHLFSWVVTLERSLLAAGWCMVGIFSGCVLVPLLLPWIPGRAFAFKGALMGGVAGVLALWAIGANVYIAFWSGMALVLLAMAISSYAAMNFTGTTPFTSPSGVEKEMRKAIPLQVAAVLMAAGLWVGAAF